MKRLYAVILVFGLLVMAAIAAAGSHGTRITKEELKAKMDKGEDIVVLDVRVSSSYLDSMVKIKGAVRIDPDSIARKYQSLPKDKEIITYCT